MTTKKYLSVKEAAKHTGINANYLREFARCGALPAVRFSESPKAKWYFDVKELDKVAKINAERSRKERISN